MGGAPPPPTPPVDQDVDSQAVIVPSFLAATFTLAKPDGRLPPINSSVARSKNSFTGLPPLCFERCAASMPQRSEANLLPKPPPTLSMCTCTFVGGILSVFERSPPIPETFCVDGKNSTWSPFHPIAWPCDSRQQCVITGMPYDPSETTSAS